MSWLAFVSWPLAAAAAACAAGPLLIHLLNRRRYRTVEWAAMEYLLQAMQRNRRILRLRDLLLLLLRTAAVLLVGLGLAQPYFTSDRTAAFDGSQPLHAVLLVDNSLSMGSQSLQGDLLQAAKRRGVELIRRLPAGSRITVAPLCGAGQGLAAAAFQSPEHAEEALQRIELAARTAPASAALNLARQAWQTEPELAKRLVLLTDLQAVNWQGAEAWDEDKPLQVVALRGAARGNTWVESLSVEDNLADVETPALITVVVRHEGDAPRQSLQVTLRVDGVASGVQTIDLPARGRRVVTFQHLFNDLRPEPGRPRETLLEASLPEDRLSQDDRRWHVAHVVASLPVVFVDSLGDREDALSGRIGETRHLRKLLAPEADERSLIRIRHLRPDQLNRDQLADARLAVVAGVEQPGAWAELLLDYVRQGGQLLIAAGGSFQPAAWTDAAWRDGRHLLPLPLAAELVGSLPSDAGGTLEPFFLDFDSLRNSDYFRIAGVSENELRDLYAEPLFFQAAEVEQQHASRLDGENDGANDGGKSQDKRDRESAEGDGPAGDAADDVLEDNAADDAADDARPRWVAWPPRGEPGDVWGRPRVLARYQRGRLPFLVQRQVGEGQVVFLSTGLLAEWSTLPRTNAVLVLDRLLRAMLRSTLAERNYTVQDRLNVPLPEGSQRLQWELQRPGGEHVAERLEPGFVGRQVRGITIERPLQAGPYLLRGRSRNDDAPPARIPLAVAAPSEESQLTPAAAAELRQQLGAAVQFVEPGEAISLAGQQTRGQDLGWWMLAGGLAMLLIELLILSPQRIRAARSAAGGEAVS